MPYNTYDSLLFYRFEISDIQRDILAKLNSEIENMQKDQFLNMSATDLSEYLVSKYEMVETSLDASNAVVSSEEGYVEVGGIMYGLGRDETQRVKGTIVTLEIPIVGETNAFNIKPSTYTMNPPRGKIRENNLNLEIRGTNIEESTLQAKFDNMICSVNGYLQTYNNDVKAFNKKLLSVVETAIERRRSNLLQNEKLLSGLSFKLKERDDAPKTYTAPLTRKKIAPRMPVVSGDKYEPEPTLADSDYNNILKIISDMTMVMERSPKSFSSMEEEDIRQHYLVQLNGQYEGKATGETFNSEGKTDILIRHEGKNIFVAECKFWRGEKSHTETINQILSYLCWRDTKAAILIFNRNKNFSNVLEKMRTTTEQHPSFKSGPKALSETRFQYIFGQKDDPNREIVLTVMAFDIPSAS